ncbi:agamous-like MADS-box protein AGL61 [Punica granatum]|uniref:MADS-box domain-containing protein n=2 Tax=Punica granatum TaxID=22663 RepID=A0A218W096_PUNGR|nr:agamous-like MADS-box protein AGL61 [Punica granatum]OWM66254.1 hypothetical protein CDL15_Pgr013471 [Punica granatum]PKI50142.1 hypothetical protein CRG98_029466 [Punica granatum]
MELAEPNGRKYWGRQKIKIKKIEDDQHRFIMFSSRRAMIYKKASELATLCGAEIGIVVFSPTGKPFSFGIPTIDAVVERFLNRNTSEQPPDDGGMEQMLEAQQRTRIEKIRQNLNKTLAKLEAEKKRDKSLKQLIKTAREPNAPRCEVGWWDAKIEALNPAQLEQVSTSIEQFYGDLMKHMKKRQQLQPQPQR